MPSILSPSALVCEALSSFDPRWNRNPAEVSGAWYEYVLQYPGLAPVDDGPTERGRGTSLVDLVRKRTSGVVMFDFLSVKTVSLDGEKRGKVSITGGARKDTLGAMVAAPSVPTIIVGNATADVCRVVCLDVARIFSQYGVVPIEDYPAGGYGRGRAPVVYEKWSARRPCGQKRARMLANAGCPEGTRYDADLGVLIGPGWRQYRELVISLYQLGIDWADMPLEDIGPFVDWSFGW